MCVLVNVLRGIVELDKAHSHIQMAGNILGNGKMENRMDKAHLPGIMAINMLGNLKII